MSTQYFVRSGGFEGDYLVIDLPDLGRYTIDYWREFYSAKDRMEISYDGRVLLDSGYQGGIDEGSMEIVRREGDPSQLFILIGTRDFGTLWDYTLTVTGFGGDEAPTAVDDTLRFMEGDVGGREIALAANDIPADEPLDLDSIVIVDQPLYGEVSVRSDGTVIYTSEYRTPRDDRFTYTIADTNGDRSEVATVTIEGVCPSPDPLVVTGPTLTHDMAQDICIGEGRFYLGRIDGREQMLLHDGGTVKIAEDWISAENVKVFAAPPTNITAATPWITKHIFGGSYTIGTDGRTTMLNDANIAGDLDPAGLEFFVDSMVLGPQTASFNGRLEMPWQLGGLMVPFRDGTALKVDEAGVRFGDGTIRLPSFTYDFYDKLSVEQTLATLSWDVGQDLIKYQGKIKVAHSELFKNAQFPDGTSFTLDLTGDNFVQIKAGVPDFKGFASIENLAITPHWGLKQAKLYMVTVNGELTKVEGTAALGFPFKGKPVVAGGTLGFVVDPAVELTTVGLEVGGLNLPIGTTGVFFQSVKGKLQGFSSNDPDGLAYSGGLGFSVGPKVAFNLPTWFRPDPIEAAPVSLELDGALKVDRATGDAKLAGQALLKVVTDGVFDIKLNTESNLTQFTLGGTAEIKVLGGLVSGNAKANANFTAGTLSAFGVNAVNVPDVRAFGILRGRELDSASVKLDFTNDGFFANDAISFWKTVHFFGRSTVVGARIALDGDIDIINGADELPLIGSWATAGTEPFLMMTAEWENAQSEPVEIRVTYNDGVNPVFTFDEADFAANGIQVVADLSGPYAKTVAVETPAAGIWDIVVVDPAPLGEITYTGYGEGDTSEITLTSATPQAFPYQITVGYEAFAADSDAQIALYYDTDMEGFDGTLIATDLVEADGPGTYGWRPAGAPTGDLYLYAVITDDSGVPVFSDYLETPVRATPESDLSIEIVGPERAAADQTVEYVFQITHDGTGYAESVELTVDVTGMDVISRSGVSTQTGDQIVFRLFTFLPGQTKTVSIKVEPREGAASMDVLATVAGYSAETDASDNSALLQTRVGEKEVLDLGIDRVVHHDPGDTTIGTLDYDLVVTNYSTLGATSVTIVEEIGGPVDLEPQARTSVYLEESDLYVYRTVAEDRITWEIGGLAAGEQFVLSNAIEPRGVGDIVLTGSVSHADADPNAANDVTLYMQTVDKWGTVSPPADLSLYGTIDVADPAVGDTVELAWRVLKEDGGFVGGIQVRVDLPDGLDFIGTLNQPFDVMRPTFGTYDPVTGLWDLGTLQDDDGWLIIQAQVTSEDLQFAEGEIIASSDTDPDSTPDNGEPFEDDIYVVAVNSTNQRPVWTLHGQGRVAFEGQAFSYQLPEQPFTDADGDTVAWRAVEMPEWMSWDEATRTLSGTPGSEDVTASPDHVRFYATDGLGGYRYGDLIMQVFAEDRPWQPLYPNPDRRVNVDVPVNIRISAIDYRDPDIFGEADWQSYGYLPELPELSAGAVPSWLNVDEYYIEEQLFGTFEDAEGNYYEDPIILTSVVELSGTPGEGDSGRFEIDVFAEGAPGDPVGTDTFTITVNAPPVDSGASGDGTMDGAGVRTYTLPAGLFVDADGDPLELSAREADGDPLPVWLSFDPATGTFSGNPSSSDEGTLLLSLRASDGRGAYADKEIALEISNANDAPTGIMLSSLRLREGAPVGTAVGAVGVLDPDSGDRHTLTLVDDAGGRFALVDGHLVSTAALETTAGASHTVRVRGTDPAGAAIEHAFVIAIVAGTALFTEEADLVNFDSGAPADFFQGTQYQALAGDDRIVLPGDAAAAALAGYDPSVPFEAGEGKDFVRGGGLSERILGGAGDDTLEGGDGDDTLDGGIDRDEIDGGAGFDIIDYAFATSPLDVSLARGDLRLAGTIGPWETFTGIEGVIGGVAGDLLEGDGAANLLMGGAGQDTLHGGNGDDTLDGGIGADAFDGGDGRDTIDYGFAFATVRLDLDLARGDMRFVGGTAPVETIVGVENVIGGLGPDRLTGDAQANVLDGNSGDDWLAGGDGDDTLIGGIGRDTFDGGAGNDWVDCSFANAFTRLDIDLDRGDMRLVGGPVAVETITGVENVIGGASWDLLAGNGAANVLDGRSGDDYLSGGGGDDTLIGGIGRDSFDGGAGSDTVDYGFANSVTRLDVDLERGDMRLFGGLVPVETIVGVENVVGGDGDDVLAGNAEDNRLTGGAGQDRFVFGDGSGADVVADFEAGDVIDLRGNSTLHGFAAVLAATTVAGSDTVIDLGGGTLTLENIVPLDLAAGDFVF